MKQIPYEESFGPYSFPEGFEERLKGLTIEEQMNCYRTTEYSSYAMTGWSERTYRAGYQRLERCSDVRALIVKDGLLIGVMIRDDNCRDVPCFAEERICTYYADDNNGAGSKTRIDYVYLVCVPDGFEEDPA